MEVRVLKEQNTLKSEGVLAMATHVGDSHSEQ
jgi:hypothetical protein